ncbi:MAG: deaminase [Candidatus Woesearchaeota archaeon]
MKYLYHQEVVEAINYLNLAAEIAKDSTCLRSRCGSVIVKDEEIIGRGYNSPPGNLESQIRCSCLKSEYHQKVTDKTCCVHAEQRAIMDALKKNTDRLGGSRLYFIRIDEEDLVIKAGKPYCTICSKMALDVGIAEFVLWHEKGICVYGTKEYNELSYQFM